MGSEIAHNWRCVVSMASFDTPYLINHEWRVLAMQTATYDDPPNTWHNSTDYVQHLLENIINNIPDVDFVFVKLIHASNTLHQQLTLHGVADANTFIKLLILHINCCSQLLADLRNNQSTVGTLKCWKKSKRKMTSWLKKHDQELAKSWITHCKLMHKCLISRSKRHTTEEQRLWELNQDMAQQFSHLLVKICSPS